MKKFKNIIDLFLFVFINFILTNKKDTMSKTKTSEYLSIEIEDDNDYDNVDIHDIHHNSIITDSLNNEIKKDPKKKREKVGNVLEPSFYHDEHASKLEIGVDEVGRGPLFGRVYSAAVVLPKAQEDTHFDFSKLKDSKKFHSKSKINEVSKYIKENALFWAIAFEDETTIDEINILQATQRAMHKAILDVKNQIVESLLTEKEYFILVDGNYFKPITKYNKETSKYDTIPYQTVEGGDNKYCSIAAASILAKVERDTYIEELCKEHPELIEHYGLDSNKGYGSKKHLEGIATYGITKWHRKTFGICKRYPS